jgi:Cys-tRNA(Pro) deacylase
MTPQERVTAALERAGLPSHLRTFADSTATAADAAAAVGCELGQIVKTLFFLADGRPTLALVAGDQQVDTARLAELLGVGRKRLRMAAPDEVLAITGYPVGGVSPFGSLTQCDVVVDESLRRFDTVWAAAGSPHAVFAAPTTELVSRAGGQWAVITRQP